MADIIKFGQSMLGTAKVVAGNCDRNDLAAFFVLQHNAVQNASAEARRSGGGKPAAGGGQAQQGGQQSAAQAGSAMARLQAMMKGMK